MTHCPPARRFVRLRPLELPVRNLALQARERNVKVGDNIVFVTTLILVLWYAAIAAKAAAAYRLYRDGLVTRFATLWVYLVVCTTRSVALLPFQGDLERYQRLYAYSMPLVSLLEGFAVAGVFWAVAEQYPRFRRPGSVILSCLAGIGACAVWLTHF